jgi:hypothetical protein
MFNFSPHMHLYGKNLCTHKASAPVVAAAWLSSRTEVGYNKGLSHADSGDLWPPDTRVSQS